VIELILVAIDVSKSFVVVVSFDFIKVCIIMLCNGFLNGEDTLGEEVFLFFSKFGMMSQLSARISSIVTLL
jgi:hypothetical protein